MRAVHVGVFLRGDPERGLAVVVRCLAPDGRLLLVDEPLDPAGGAEGADRLAATPDRHGFAVQRRVVADLAATRGVGVMTGVAPRLARG